MEKIEKINIYLLNNINIQHNIYLTHCENDVDILKNLNKEYRFQCNKNIIHIFNDIIPNIIRRKNKCILCYLFTKSKLEEQFFKILYNMNFILEKDFFRQKKLINNNENETYFFDFHIPIFNLLIELDGDLHLSKQFWYRKRKIKNRKSYKSDKEHQKYISKDIRQNIFCKRNNFNLLRISFLDNKNIKNIFQDTICKILKFNYKNHLFFSNYSHYIQTYNEIGFDITIKK